VALINATSIRQAPRTTVTCLDLRLPVHNVVNSERMGIESYLDTGDRSNFEKSGDFMRSFVDFSTPSYNLEAIYETQGYAPLVVAGAESERFRNRVNTFRTAAVAAA
jgi:hypothetical protein